MPEEETIERAREDAREGKSPSTQAGEFVREEMEHIREGEHGARSPEQAIALDRPMAIACSGDRHWSIQSAASRGRVAASETRQPSDKAPGKTRSHQGSRQSSQNAVSETLPRNQTSA